MEETEEIFREEERRKLNKTGNPQGINSKETCNSPWGQEGLNCVTIS
jgi:hypothetical protein